MVRRERNPAILWAALLVLLAAVAFASWYLSQQGEDESRPDALAPETDKPPRPKRPSLWDPPPDLAHHPDTPPELRDKIDRLVATMFRWENGLDRVDAQKALVAIGKPAFPRILGAMSKARGTITDVDSFEERKLESSLKLADEALRQMDGWLDEKGVPTLRPGSEKRFVAYICRLHYKRWMQVLKDAPELPGPHEPKTERVIRDTGTSRWDPPADLGHLEGTPPELREKIDALVATMLDWEMGRDSLTAKEALVAIGKPAFPRILGAMARVRDTITDVDSQDERMLESSLKLADECLREMDGWLTAKGKSVLRPGSEKKYIAYICRLHYKRWMQVLKDAPELPGPYDPSEEYEGEVVPKNRWDPPATLGHLAETPPNLRKRIDRLMLTMMKPGGGDEARIAMRELVAIGKPAFPRVLGAMAGARDEFTGADSRDGPRLRRSMMLTDLVLREMDGWQTEQGRPKLLPGEERSYLASTCRRHYKRWVQFLQYLDELPGPFDPALWSRMRTSVRMRQLDERLAKCENDPRAMVAAVFAWYQEDPPPASLPRPPAARKFLELFPASLLELGVSSKTRHDAGLLLVDELTDKSLEIRRAARNCLRVLYARTIAYDPDCPVWRRKEKQAAWAKIVEENRK